MLALRGSSCWRGQRIIRERLCLARDASIGGGVSCTASPVPCRAPGTVCADGRCTNCS